MAKTIRMMSASAGSITGIGCRGGLRHTGQPSIPRSHSTSRRPMGKPRFFSVLRGNYKRLNGFVMRSKYSAESTSTGWI